MKQILFLILFTSICWGQRNIDVDSLAKSIKQDQKEVRDYWRAWYEKFDTKKFLCIGTEIPRHTLTICNESGKKALYLDCNDDSLKVSGTLAIDSAGMVFFKWCIERYAGRITELKDEIAILKKAKQ